MSEIGVKDISDEELMGLAMDATMGGTIKLAKIKALDVSDVYQILKKAR